MSETVLPPKVLTRLLRESHRQHRAAVTALLSVLAGIRKDLRETDAIDRIEERLMMLPEVLDTPTLALWYERIEEPLP